MATEGMLPAHAQRLLRPVDAASLAVFRIGFGALMLVVDVRRGLKNEDVGLLEWAGLPEAGLHVLLSKADQLSQSERVKVLRQTQQQLAGVASVQLFSSLKGLGLDEARSVLQELTDRARVAPEHYRRTQQDWLKRAAQVLAGL